ncbi:MAG: outer membrane lipid asymmetry maintenance protein MlaD [Gammaproteobacteria bacterium]|nr:outer membrane lipid asymmetry maintenance protein MlaD [Gammaproteobacteria bacterium]
MSRRAIEVWVGLFVLGGALALFMLAMKASNLTTVSTADAYQVMARFANVGGLNVKSPVKASGVLVGRVSNISYDDGSHEALVTLSIEKRFDRFPADTSASIYTAGLLGEQYIGLAPGAEEEMLKEGSTIMFTDSAVVLEQMISQFMYKKMADDDEKQE